MRRAAVLLTALLAGAAAPGEATRTVVLVPASLPPGFTGPKPAPMTLHIPPAYVAPGDAAAGDERPTVEVAVLLPGLVPVAPGQSRCGQPVCGDEVVALIQLAPEPPPGLGPGTLKDEVAAGPLARTPGATLDPVPPPPGFEEAVHLFKPSPPGRDYRGFDIQLLAYRDNAGNRWVGECSMADAQPACAFRVFDPALQLGITYGLPFPLLPQRQAVEDGLRALVAGWVVPPSPGQLEPSR